MREHGHRRFPRREALLGALVLVVAALVGAGQGGSTYAAYSDFRVLADNHAGAGVWGTDLPLLPQACRDIGFVPTNWFVITEEGSFWSDGVATLVTVGPGIPGSTMNGAFHGTDQSDFIVNLGPRRTLHGTGGDDCLVAGEFADILHGGPGNDVLIGGKKQHSGEYLFDAAPLAAPMTTGEQGYLDGESGADLCVPGPADVIVNCETLDGSAGAAPAPEEAPVLEPQPLTAPRPPVEELTTEEPPKEPQTEPLVDTAPLAEEPPNELEPLEGDEPCESAYTDGTGTEPCIEDDEAGA